MSESAGAASTNPLFVDPLSEVTRKERLYLLGVSTVGVTIVLTRLVPTEIRALGITFARADRESILLILALVVGYFLMAFVIYAASDFLAWRNLFREQERSRARQELEEEILSRSVELNSEQLAQQMRIEIDRRMDEMEVSWRKNPLPGLVSSLRGLFEFGLPIIYGIVAIYLLLFVGLPPADGNASLEFIQAHVA